MRTDEDLARGLQQGSTADLIVLVERHHGDLIGYLYRMTGGDRALAEDLVQESFLRLLAHIDRYTYPRPFKTWLYAIATNIARDHFKSADARRTVESPEEGIMQSYHPQPEAHLIHDETTRRVVDAIASLPQAQREVIVLRYTQELSLAEIAAILSIPVGTVKSRLSIGLRRLRERLGHD